MDSEPRKRLLIWIQVPLSWIESIAKITRRHSEGRKIEAAKTWGTEEHDVESVGNQIRDGQIHDIMDASTGMSD